MTTDRRSYESIRRNFEPQEMAAMHQHLVEAVGEVKNLRGEKAQVTTEINAQIKAAEKAVWAVQEKLANGYETLDVEVITVMDAPQPGTKQIVRVDTNEVLRELPMTAAERQTSLGFEE
jgi:hypothetical protein